MLLKLRQSSCSLAIFGIHSPQAFVGVIGLLVEVSVLIRGSCMINFKL